MTLTRADIEGRIKQANANASVTLGRDELIELAGMALDRLDMEPRPIAKMTAEIKEAYVYYAPGQFWSRCSCLYNEDGELVHASNLVMQLSKGYTHFIPLSVMPKVRA